jgi:hypothetical protein
MTKELLNQLGWKHDKTSIEGVYYKTNAPGIYLYFDDIKKLTLKEFVENELKDAYNAGYKRCQYDIRQLIGASQL